MLEEYSTILLGYSVKSCGLVDRYFLVGENSHYLGSTNNFDTFSKFNTYSKLN